MLQENRNGVAGCVRRSHPQEPGVRRLFFTSDSDSPVRDDVLPVALPGPEQFSRDGGCEDGTELSGSGALLPVSPRAPLRAATYSCITSASIVPEGKVRRPFRGERTPRPKAGLHAAIPVTAPDEHICPPKAKKNGTRAAPVIPPT